MVCCCRRRRRQKPKPVTAATGRDQLETSSARYSLQFPLKFRRVVGYRVMEIVL